MKTAKRRRIEHRRSGSFGAPGRRNGRQTVHQTHQGYPAAWLPGRRRDNPEAAPARPDATRAARAPNRWAGYWGIETIGGKDDA